MLALKCSFGTSHRLWNRASSPILRVLLWSTAVGQRHSTASSDSCLSTSVALARLAPGTLLASSPLKWMLWASVPSSNCVERAPRGSRSMSVVNLLANNTSIVQVQRFCPVCCRTLLVRTAMWTWWSNWLWHRRVLWLVPYWLANLLVQITECKSFVQSTTQNLIPFRVIREFKSIRLCGLPAPTY